MQMRRITLFLFLLHLAFAPYLRAQSPAPIVVQAASPATVTSIPSPSVTQDSGSLQATLKMLQEMKAANAETLKKQEAALQQLDEIQKAAEQLKIFGKRG
jgi:uncharacterized membrane protein (DUF106 family)